jgi:outer membrane protein OmpA-like peptidoglycan-associated protein
VVLTISDTLGSRGSYNGTIATDVLVIRDGDVLRIRIPGIEFPANSANLAGVSADKMAKNNRTLDRLAEILRKYGSYAITVEGHANITQYWDAKLADDENKKELIPLSEKRADAVRSALVQRGIVLSRMNIIGVGGTRPVVPNRDVDNVWKNRRVEFILKK